MTEYNGNFDVLVLGGGICAQSILFEMIKDAHFDLDSLSVAQISSSDVFTPCTDNTTSVLSLSGASKGINDLGDMIVDSFHYTVSYVKKHNLTSFYEGNHYYVFPKKEEKQASFIRRHGSAFDFEAQGLSLKGFKSKNFVIDSKGLDLELKSEISKSNIKNIKDVIVDISKDKVVTCLSGKKFKARKIISCLGAYSNVFLRKFECDHLEFSKKVPGDFLTFNECDLGEESFVISSGHHNLVYRAFSKTVLIGGTTLKTEWDAIDYIDIKDQYNCYKEIFKERLPSFDLGLISSGMRHKGRKRRAFCGEISKDIFSVHGIYKNGYSFSFFLAPRVIKYLLD